MLQKNLDLSALSEEELLNLRICNLPIKIEGTWLQDCVNRLYSELDSKGIRFKPTCYLTDEWFTPENEPVVGIPFFLAHPVLMRLERKMMLDVEGGTKQWCMKLLRHETGHALNYAYKLYKRKKWQKIFGKFSQEYTDTYRFRPYSKSFVRHLEDYYAQYHPDEDFAETFAVWLTPGLDWQSQYKGWRALTKLRYVDELVKEIKDKEPLIKKGKKYWPASSLRIKLKNYYKKKQYSYAEDFPDFHDANLKRIFVEKSKDNKHLLGGADIIKKYRKEILETVSTWTGEKKYIINELLNTLIERCRELHLLCQDDEQLTMLKISAYITTLIMNYLYTGRFRGRR
jgi:hypothetical protein